MGQLGFSYIGLLFLLALFFPNLLWRKRQPRGYTSEGENRILLGLERCGEALVCCCALLFSDFNWHGWSPWCLWLFAAVLCMALYELWWIRYFRSARELSDFYSSLLGIPVAGATLPVLAFFLLGVYGKVAWMLASTVILGIGHIGVHLQHRRKLSASVPNWGRKKPRDGGRPT